MEQELKYSLLITVIVFTVLLTFGAIVVTH
ncbi:YnhF family membrane protein [Vibrio lamellibrachiae]